MNKIITAIAFLGIINTIKAQITETREVTPFNKLEISGSANVFYKKSDTIVVKVESSQNDRDNIIITNESDILVIKAKGISAANYKIYVNAPEIKKITINGAAKLSGLNTLITDTLFVDASGASDVSLDVETNMTDVILGGASGVTFSGKTKTLNAKISGASSLKSYKLISAITNVTASGASTAKVYANEKVNASATGSSSIKIKGDPQEVSAEASSSSSIAKVANDEGSKKSTKNDSTTFNFKSKKFIIIDKEDEDIKVSTEDHFHHWSGLAFGVNGYTSGSSFTIPKAQKHMELNYGRSFNFQFNPFETNIHLYKNYVNLVTGLGFDWTHYEFRNNTKLDPDNSNYTTGMIDTSGLVFFKKNRLNVTYLQAPLLLEFNTHKDPKKAFHIAVGVEAAYKLTSKTRQIIKINADEQRLVRKDSYNINPWRFNAYASVGYSGLTLFATYALNPLFENGKGPELYPFTAGIKFLNF